MNSIHTNTLTSNTPADLYSTHLPQPESLGGLSSLKTLLNTAQQSLNSLKDAIEEWHEDDSVEHYNTNTPQNSQSTSQSANHVETIVAVPAATSSEYYKAANPILATSSTTPPNDFFSRSVDKSFQPSFNQLFTQTSQKLFPLERYAKSVDQFLNMIKTIKENRTKLVETLANCLKNLSHLKDFHASYLKEITKSCIKYLYPGEILPLLKYVSKLPFNEKYAPILMELLYKSASAVDIEFQQEDYRVMPKLEYFKYTEYMLQQLGENPQIIKLVGHEKIAKLMERLLWTHSRSYLMHIEPNNEQVLQKRNEIIEKLRTLLPNVADYLTIVLNLIDKILNYPLSTNDTVEENTNFILELEKLRLHFIRAQRLNEWKMFLHVVQLMNYRRKQLRKMIEEWEKTQPQKGSNDWFFHMKELSEKMQDKKRKREQECENSIKKRKVDA